MPFFPTSSFDYFFSHFLTPPLVPFICFMVSCFAWQLHPISFQKIVARSSLHIVPAQTLFSRTQRTPFSLTSFNPFPCPFRENTSPQAHVSPFYWGLLKLVSLRKMFQAPKWFFFSSLTFPYQSSCTSSFQPVVPSLGVFYPCSLFARHCIPSLCFRRGFSLLLL